MNALTTPHNTNNLLLFLIVQLERQRHHALHAAQLLPPAQLHNAATAHSPQGQDWTQRTDAEHLTPQIPTRP
jgi:hypothetical protein